MSSLKQVFRLLWINFIKIVSLALGICISVALLCKVAWERSFDNFWQEGDNLLYVETVKNYKVEVNGAFEHSRMECHSAVAPEIAQKIATVASATRFTIREPYSYEDQYIMDNKHFSINTYYVDTAFFDILQIKMIQGEDPKEIIKTPGKVIISEKTAAMIFPDGDALGGQLCKDDEIYTVSGICRDIPANSFFPNAEVIIGEDIPCTFEWGDRWYTLLRTHQKPDLEKLSDDITTLLKPQYAHRTDAKISFRVNHLYNCHKISVVESNAILSVIALALLFISGLSFALLSINSLSSRAKEVGVRKAAGAKVSCIFSLIIGETILYVLTATLLSAVIFWGCKSQLENITGSYQEIFTIDTLWAVGLVLFLLIVIAGAIPAQIFSRIPVTQVFQRFTSDRIHWKRILLFFQFTASIFVICFMFIILRQYHVSFFRDLGFDKEKLVWATAHYKIPKTQQQALMAEIMADSRVEAATRTGESVWYGLSGITVSLDPNDQYPCFGVELTTDSSFFKTFGVPLIYGSDNFATQLETGGNVIVNQCFLEKLNIGGDPIGQVFYSYDATLTIAGVCADFETVMGGLTPMVITIRDFGGCQLTIRVNEITSDVIKTIQNKMNEYSPNEYDANVSTYSDHILSRFGDVRMLRDKIILASFFLLLITIMGILGYVNLEIRRRTKEIAIRKIHGSTVIEVIWKISRGLLFAALIAAAVVVPLAYFVGSRWQQKFAIKAQLSWYIFAAGVFVVVTTIAICAILQTWRTSTANPTKGIKSE